MEPPVLAWRPDSGCSSRGGARLRREQDSEADGELADESVDELFVHRCDGEQSCADDVTVI
jgi:hypothetical protein